MRGKLWTLLTCCSFASAAIAEPVTPARGSVDRDDLLAIARTLTGYDLGGPIELVVDHMKVDGDRAFMKVQPQRPGGVPIDLAQTPTVLLRDDSPGFYDGTVLIAYLSRIEGNWYVYEYAIGSTDVWWVGNPYCSSLGFRSVMPANSCPN